MRGNKKRYKVFQRTVLEEELPQEERYEGPWIFEGSTCAVSEAKAINNIRFRDFGSESMSMPLSARNSGAVWREWRAELVS